MKYIGFVFVLAFLSAFYGFMGCTTVPAGHVGVISSFGEVQSIPLGEGMSFVAPWKKVISISLQTIEDKEEADVPTREGLTVRLEVSLLYSMNKDQASHIYQTVGEKYSEVIVKPQFRSALRGATVKHDAKDLYTANRAEIESDLEKAVTASLGSRGILCEKILLRSITLPKMVRDAIEDKIASEQTAQKMQFVIQKETAEAERKRVEAKGIADSQAIIQGTLTDAYLRYLWIKSLETAANHNATIIYVPTGHDGLPFFKEAGKEGVRK